MKWQLFVLALGVLSASYLIDEQQYFYLNTSYSRGLISFTACFSLHQPLSLQLQSEVLVPQGNHSIKGTFDNEKSILFDTPYDPDRVGFNNYNEGQYWLGVKIPFENTQKDHFIPLKVGISTPNQTFNYVFLLSLFAYPLTGFEIAPQNSLRVCHQEYLVSSRYHSGEFDVSVFGIKEGPSFEVKEKGSWGYFHDKAAIKFLRWKGRKGEELTLTQKGTSGKTCKLDKGQGRAVAEVETGYTLDQLLASELPFADDSQL